MGRTSQRPSAPALSVPHVRALENTFCCMFAPMLLTPFDSAITAVSIVVSFRLALWLARRAASTP